MKKRLFLPSILDNVKIIEQCQKELFNPPLEREETNMVLESAWHRLMAEEFSLPEEEKAVKS